MPEFPVPSAVQPRLPWHRGQACGWRGRRGLSQLSSNLSGVGRCWKGKNCFIELSPDMSPSAVEAASCLLGTPSCECWRWKNSREGCLPASPAWLSFPGVQLNAAHSIALSRLLHLFDIPFLFFLFSDLPFLLFLCTGPPSISFTFLKHKKRCHTVLVSNVSHCLHQNVCHSTRRKVE